MVLRLATALDVPLRHANAMLRAAGHRPWYPEPESGDSLPPRVRSTLELMKEHHDPFPLIVIDRTYRVLDVNAGAVAVLGAVLPDLDPGQGELNLARVTLDPAAGARVIVNHAAVARELMWRMQREVLADPDNGRLRDMVAELLQLPGVDPDWRRPDPTSPSSPTLELQLRVGAETWSFLLVVSTLQAPLEVSLDELRIEQWFPADDLTTERCRALRPGMTATRSTEVPRLRVPAAPLPHPVRPRRWPPGRRWPGRMHIPTFDDVGARTRS